MPEWLTQLINSVVVIGLVAFIAKSVFKAIDRLTDRQEDHEKECAKIPKSTIIEKLEALREQQAEHHRENTRRIQEIRHSLDAYHKRTGLAEDDIINIKNDLRWMKDRKP